MEVEILISRLVEPHLPLTTQSTHLEDLREARSQEVLISSVAIRQQIMKWQAQVPQRLRYQADTSVSSPDNINAMSLNVCSRRIKNQNNSRRELRTPQSGIWLFQTISCQKEDRKKLSSLFEQSLIRTIRWSSSICTIMTNHSKRHLLLEVMCKAWLPRPTRGILSQIYRSICKNSNTKQRNSVIMKGVTQAALASQAALKNSTELTNSKPEAPSHNYNCKITRQKVVSKILMSIVQPTSASTTTQKRTTFITRSTNVHIHFNSNNNRSCWKRRP